MSFQPGENFAKFVGHFFGGVIVIIGGSAYCDYLITDIYNSTFNSTNYEECMGELITCLQDACYE